MRVVRLVAALVLVATLVLAGCGRPSQAELRSNLVDDMQDAGLTRDQATRIADCVAPKMYAQLGASSLEAIIADGVANAKIDADDADAGDAILEECLNEVMDD